MKCIVLCADDYGQTLSISQGIAALIGQQRLSATSCMVNQPDWLESSKILIPLKNDIDVGLHFNLTFGTSLSDNKPLLPLSQLMLLAFMRRLDENKIAAELNAQLDQFIAAFGVLPDFIDGHQHVHQFPVIRDVMIAVYQARFRDHQAYIRWVNPKFPTLQIKQAIIYLSGTVHFKSLLRQSTIPHNTSFSGIYSFNESANYRQYFCDFLDTIEDNGIIMCHPGYPIETENDEIAAARALEYQYFMSDHFLADCSAHGVKIGRFNRANIDNKT